MFIKYNYWVSVLIISGHLLDFTFIYVYNLWHNSNKIVKKYLTKYKCHIIKKKMYYLYYITLMCIETLKWSPKTWFEAQKRKKMTCF